MAPVAIMNHSSTAPNGFHKYSKSWRPTERLDSPKRSTFAFDPIEDALASFAAGEFLVVMDDENRENEGDLIISGSHCTTEKMAWMIKHTRCVTFHTKPPIPPSSISPYIQLRVLPGSDPLTCEIHSHLLPCFYSF